MQRRFQVERSTEAVKFSSEFNVNECQSESQPIYAKKTTSLKRVTSVFDGSPRVILTRRHEVQENGKCIQLKAQRKSRSFDTVRTMQISCKHVLNETDKIWRILSLIHGPHLGFCNMF